MIELQTALQVFFWYVNCHSNALTRRVVDSELTITKYKLLDTYHFWAAVAWWASFLAASPGCPLSEAQTGSYLASVEAPGVAWGSWLGGPVAATGSQGETTAGGRRAGAALETTTTSLIWGNNTFILGNNDFSLNVSSVFTHFIRKG